MPRPRGFDSNMSRPCDGAVLDSRAMRDLRVINLPRFSCAILSVQPYRTWRQAMPFSAAPRALPAKPGGRWLLPCCECLPVLPRIAAFLFCPLDAFCAAMKASPEAAWLPTPTPVELLAFDDSFALSVSGWWPCRDGFSRGCGAAAAPGRYPASGDLAAWAVGADLLVPGASGCQGRPDPRPPAAERGCLSCPRSPPGVLTRTA